MSYDDAITYRTPLRILLRPPPKKDVFFCSITDAQRLDPLSYPLFPTSHFIRDVRDRASKGRLKRRHNATNQTTLLLDLWMFSAFIYFIFLLYPLRVFAKESEEIRYQITRNDFPKTHFRPVLCPQTGLALGKFLDTRQTLEITLAPRITPAEIRLEVNFLSICFA